MKTVRDRDRRELLRMLPKNAVCGEVGVLRGYFSKQILDEIGPERLHLIDCWAEQPENPDKSGGEDQAAQDSNLRQVHAMVNAHVFRHKVSIHRAWAQDAVPTFPDGYFDWVYLDAEHTYEAVLRDLEMLSPKIKLGGYLAGHDYEEGNAWARKVRCGVVPAVAEFCRRHGWEIAAVFDDSYRNNSYALQRRA